MNRLSSYNHSTFTSSYSNYYNTYGFNYGSNYFSNFFGGFAKNYAPTAPEFVYTASTLVRGQAKAGDLIAIVRSSDSNGDILSYHLSGNDAGYYAVNSKTGYITLTATGAYAMNNGLSLPSVSVVAYDGKTTSQTSTLSFSDPEPVNVNHAPETPVITSEVTQFVKGQVKIGDVVAKAAAVDVDGDSVTYHLMSNHGGAYIINAKTGVVSLSAIGVAMVNAGQNLPDVKVVAYDGQAVSTVGTLDVANTTVEVVAVNHAPSAPTVVSSGHLVAGKASAGMVVATLNATDADGDALSYHLLRNDGSYEINSATGEVRLTNYGAQVLNQTKALPDLMIAAHDGKEWGQTSTFKIQVEVDNPAPNNPNPPVPPVDNQPVDVQFQVDTTFHDSRDLSAVQLPYFIKILDTEKAGYLSKVWEGPGKGAEVSYAFATSASDSGKGYSFTVKGFQEYSDTQKQAVRDALQLYEEQTNLKFTEVDANNRPKANFKFYLDDLTVEKTYAYNHRNVGEENGVEHNPVAYKCDCPNCSAQSVMSGDKALSSFVAGYAYFGGDVHINSTKFGGDTALSSDTKIIETTNGYYTSWISGGFGTLIHEIGHSVGLAHPFDGDNYIRQNSAEDKTHLTMMSYSNDLKENVVLQNGQTVYTTVSATQFGIFDLATLHYRFGVNEAQHAGDSTYTFKDFNRAALGNDIYIWDGSGNDTFDGSAETQSLYVNLTPGSWIYRGDYKADTLVYDAYGNVVGNQMFIGFGTQIENLKGGSGHDKLIGNETNNHIEGNAGNDRIEGGKGNDWLEGGAGNDILIGGTGNDILVGGTGQDKFVFDNFSRGGMDVIQDFNAAEGDSIVLSASVFTNLSKGVLGSQYFVSGADATARDGNDYLIFDTTSKQLYYDADGSGAREAVSIAQINNLEQLENQHIYVV